MTEWVTVRNINVGDYINKEGNISKRSSITLNLFTVADVSMLRLFVNVPAAFGAFLAGLTADVTVPQLPDRRHFTAKFPDGRPRVRCQPCTGRHGLHDRQRRPGVVGGSVCQGPSHRAGRPNVLTIPSTALVFQEHGTCGRGGRRTIVCS